MNYFLSLSWHNCLQCFIMAVEICVRQRWLKMTHFMIQTQISCLSSSLNVKKTGDLQIKRPMEGKEIKPLSPNYAYCFRTEDLDQVICILFGLRKPKSPRCQKQQQLFHKLFLNLDPLKQTN